MDGMTLKEERRLWSAGDDAERSVEEERRL